MDRARSSLEAFTALNYTLMYTYGHMDTLLIYQHIPDLVQVIIWESEQMKRCMGRTETNHNMTELKGDEMIHSPDDWQKDLKKGCMKRAGFEDGIPLWKGFTFHFWPTPSHPLGEKWTLAPYDYKEMGKDNIHLGTSPHSPAVVGDNDNGQDTRYKKDVRRSPWLKRRNIAP
jgi:hypothetical protein